MTGHWVTINGRHVLIENDGGHTGNHNPKIKTGNKTTDNAISGLQIENDIPNLSSIGASFSPGTYTVLPGIHEVSFSEFQAVKAGTKPVVNTATKQLAEQIKASGKIKPLIVVKEDFNTEAGPYILEGSHRFDALQIAGKKKFPAVIVVDHGKKK